MEQKFVTVSISGIVTGDALKEILEGLQDLANGRDKVMILDPPRPPRPSRRVSIVGSSRQHEDLDVTVLSATMHHPDVVTKLGNPSSRRG